MRNLLESVPIFAGLSDRALALLIKEGDEYAFGDKDIIFHEGEPDDMLFVIHSGKVRIFHKHGAPDETELAVLHPKELFGETCLLETLAHTATAQAVGRTVLFSISGRTFNHLYKEMPDQYGILMLNIARDLSRRVRFLDERLTKYLRRDNIAAAA